MSLHAAYDVDHVIYRGAHTIVYRARRKADQTPVIVKKAYDLYNTTNISQALRHEYQVLSCLRLDGIIKPYGLEYDDGALALVLEDIGGETLAAYRERAPLGLGEFLTLAIQLAALVVELHQQHVIHKDLNPANIIFNLDARRLQLIDFGMASQLSQERATLTNPSHLEGTLDYLSPEQTGRMNRPLDYRTDLYSLGATFYFLLTGSPPFVAADPMELIHCHLAKMPSPPNALASHIPLVLSDIVMKLLAKGAEDRYRSARGLRADLQTCFDHLQADGHIAPFGLGTQDPDDRLQIPSKLYGRDTQV